jgi:hypothetical protein
MRCRLHDRMSEAPYTKGACNKTKKNLIILNFISLINNFTIKNIVDVKC